MCYIDNTSKSLLFLIRLTYGFNNISVLFESVLITVDY